MNGLLEQVDTISETWADEVIKCQNVRIDCPNPAVWRRVIPCGCPWVGCDPCKRRIIDMSIPEGILRCNKCGNFFRPDQRTWVRL